MLYKLDQWVHECILYCYKLMNKTQSYDGFSWTVINLFIQPSKMNNNNIILLVN